MPRRAARVTAEAAATEVSELCRRHCAALFTYERGSEMDQKTDPTLAAKAIVEAYLERSMVPDPKAHAPISPVNSSSHSPAGVDLPGPPKARLSTPSAMPGSRNGSCAPMPPDPETGDVHVYNTGYLYGEWHDGTTFETNRYMDKFVVRDGKIVSTDVWNDSAEILLHKAGLAEAEL